MRLTLRTVGNVFLWILCIFFLLAALGGLIQADSDYGAGFFLVSAGVLPEYHRFHFSFRTTLLIRILLVILGIVVTLLYAEGADGLQNPAESLPGTLSQEAMVESVIDGDTIEVDLDGTKEVVRLIGITSPKVSDCFAEQAQERLSSLVLGKTVRLENAGDERDRNGMLRRYVMVEDNDMSAEMIRQGYAKSYKEYPHPRVALYDLIQQAAFSTRKGLWGPECKETE